VRPRSHPSARLPPIARKSKLPSSTCGVNTSSSTAATTTRGSLERLQKVGDIDRAEKPTIFVCNIGLRQILSNVWCDCSEIQSAATACTGGFSGFQEKQFSDQLLLLAMKAAPLTCLQHRHKVQVRFQCT